MNLLIEPYHLNLLNLCTQYNHHTGVRGQFKRMRLIQERKKPLHELVLYYATASQSCYFLLESRVTDYNITSLSLPWEDLNTTNGYYGQNAKCIYAVFTTHFEYAVVLNVVEPGSIF